MTDGQNDVLAELVKQQPQDHETNQESEDTQSRDWRGMRNALKEAKETSRRQQQELEDIRYSLRNREKAAEPEVDPWAGMEDDEVMEVKKAKTVMSKAIQRETKKAVEEALQRQKSDPRYLEQEARRRYSDFDDVMSPENVSEIVLKIPSVHDAIMKGSDPIDAAYHFISNSKVYSAKQSSKNNYELDKAIHEDKASKPKSPNQLSKSQGVDSKYPAASANGFSRLTKEQQRALWTDHNKRLGRRG